MHFGLLVLALTIGVGAIVGDNSPGCNGLGDEAIRGSWSKFTVAGWPDVPSFSFEYPTWFAAPIIEISEPLYDLAFFATNGDEVRCFRMTVFTERGRVKDLVAQHINLSLPYDEFLIEGYIVKGQTFSPRSVVSTYVVELSDSVILVFLFSRRTSEGSEEEWKLYEAIYEKMLRSMEFNIAPVNIG